MKQNFLRTLHRILFYVLCLCFVISPIYAAGQSDWIGTTSLPEAIDWPDLTLVYGNYIYSSGGAEQTPGKSLYFAPVQVDGSLGDWKSTLNLPAGSYNAWINYAAFAVNNGVIYSISGQPWFRVSSNRVYFSKIQADGAISDWSETVSIPEARMNSSAFFYNQRLYLTGGSQGWYATDLPVSTVYYTSVYSDGTLGDWTTTEPLPRARSFHTSTAYNNFVYTAGGQYKDMDKTAVEVLYAPILASGAIGTWQETTPLPDSEGANLVGCQIFVRGGCMYVLKRQGNHFKTDIKADGSIGAWTSWKATSIGVSGGDTGGFAMSENTEHFYALGGELDGGIINQVQYTAIPTCADGGGGFCFVTTAAYGSPMRPRVKLMREFRDRYLLTNAAGNAFVKLYYNHSPPIANFVAKHDTVRIIIRWGLLPLAAVSWSALKLGLATTLVLVLLICAGLISLAGVGRRKLLKKRS